MITITSNRGKLILSSYFTPHQSVVSHYKQLLLLSVAQFNLKAVLLIGYLIAWTAVHTSAQAWNELGSGINGPVTEIFPSGTDVYVGGYFLNAGGIDDGDYIARWDGCEWHAVAPGLNGSVNAIAVSGDTVYVAGSFTDVGGNVDIDGIASWDGTQWNNLGSGLDYYVTDMIIVGEDLYVGGGFNGTNDGQHACIIARWDGKDWHSLGSGPSFCAYDFAYVSDMASEGNDLYVVGLFNNMGGVAEADRIARWDGTSWHSLGSGIDPRILWNDDLQIEIDHQDIYVSGAFTNAGGNPDADYIVQWNGIDWRGLSENLADSNVSRITVYDENLYCSIYRPELGINILTIWNSQNETWERFDSLSNIIQMIADSNNIYVGGYFEEINGEPFSHIARWGPVEDCTSSSKNGTMIHPIEIQVYPNPSHDILYFSKEENVQLYNSTVTDLTGKVMIEKQAKESELNISRLAPGVLLFTNSIQWNNWNCKIY